MVIFVGKFFGNMVISITTHWSFRLYGPFLAGPDVDHISGIDCTSLSNYFQAEELRWPGRGSCGGAETGADVDAL